MSSTLVSLIIFIVLSVALLITTIVLIVKTVKGDEYAAYGGVITTFFLFVCCIVASFHGMSYAEEQKEYIEFVCKIVSLERNVGYSGSFTLGCGFVKQKQYYFYYYEVEKNVYKIDKISCSNSYIIESNKEPSVYEVKNKGTLDSYYNIYVPFGTVISQYSV